MAATKNTGGDGIGAGADDRVLATAQQILKSLNTTKNVREDMLLIFSSFDNRLSNITDLIQKDDSSSQSRLDAAEKVIFRYDSSSTSCGGGSGDFSYASSRHSTLPSFQDSPDEATEYLSALDDVLDLLDDLSIRSDAEVAERAETAVQVAMSRMEDEFRHILIRNTVPLDAQRLYGSIRRVSSLVAQEEGETDESESFAEEADEIGSTASFCFHERGGSLGDDLFVDLINADALMDLKEIADRMIRSGYEKECVQAYSSVRRDVLDECLLILGVEKLSIEEVQKIEWKSLEEKVKRWIQAVKVSVRLLLSGEKRLCDQIFQASESAKEVCFNETAKGCLMQLLNFGEAVSIARRSTEKLFRILDMYEAFNDVLPDLEGMVTDEFVCSEAKGVLHGLGLAAKGTFVEFETAVKNEASRKPMLSGEIHPLTRYIMNYTIIVVDYSKTLNDLLENDDDVESDGVQMEGLTPITKRLLALLSSLESNLEEKSKVYEDGAIRYIFLMNNILYVVQKVKGSELIKCLGDQWVRKRRGLVRQYATAYLRAAWSRALSCLKDDGFGGSSSNASKVALKERFKSFNACFEEIYRIQTGWKVPDPQLREELRISISEKVLPAYRSFLGRFGNHLESGRNVGKYIKYTPEDLENYLIDLFEGTPLVIHHLRRKSS